VSALWKRYAGRLDALTLRERLMVFAAGLVVIGALGYTLVLEPQLIKHRRASVAIAQKQSEMKAFEVQVMKVIGTRAQDPDRAERERLAQLRIELARADERISEAERRFTAPSQMRSVIEGLLARSRGVTLVELRTLAPTTVSSAPAGAKPAATPKPAGDARVIYRHGLELTVTGSYLDLLAYVRDLERLPTQLYWGALELDGSAYPKVTMKLTVYTLSPDPAWLSV